MSAHSIRAMMRRRQRSRPLPHRVRVKDRQPMLVPKTYLVEGVHQAVQLLHVKLAIHAADIQQRAGDS
jgi:hypothetical protein